MEFARGARFKASSVTRHGRHRSSPALHVTRKTRSDVSLSHRCTMEHHDCTMEHHDATGVSPETNGVKASPHRLKWMLTRGAPADPSDPWNGGRQELVVDQGLQRIAERVLGVNRLCEPSLAQLEIFSRDTRAVEHSPMESI